MNAAHSCCASPTPSDEETVLDPVCGMTVSKRSPHRHDHEGTSHFFCSAGCRSAFASDPQKYLSRAPHVHHEPHPRSTHVSPRVTEPVESAAEAEIYTCPMHPEVRRA
jgi:Cu+-exporting ATPase